MLPEPQICLGGTDLKVAGCRADNCKVQRFLGVRDLIEEFEGRRQGAWSFGLMEMLVDPVLVAWVPSWVVEQYERWNPYFRDAVRSVCLRGDTAERGRRQELGLAVKREVNTNRALLKAVRKEMIRMKEKGAADGKLASATVANALEGGASSSAESSMREDDPAEVINRVAEREDELIRDERPEPTMDGHDPAGLEGDWGHVDLAGRVSAAGPAPAAPDFRQSKGSSTSPQPFAGVVNPKGYEWDAENVVPESRVSEWKQWWMQWRGQSVDAGDEDVDPGDLDPWQKFVFDIMEYKADEREVLEKAKNLYKYDPARVLLAGGAGTGKSRVIRSIAKARKARMRRGGNSQIKIDQCCSLAAPTGCASFQIREGAATAHSVYDVPVGRFKPKGGTQDPRYVANFKRLSNARLFIVDERSMLGRVFRGKMLYRLNEYLGSKPRGFGGRAVSAGGADMLLSGDDKQILPILDEPDFYEGPYRGSGKM